MSEKKGSTIPEHRIPLETTEADVEAVKNVIEDWIKAVNAGDAEKLLSMVCDDLEMIPPSEQPVTGAQAHEFLRSFVEQFTAELKPFTNEEIVVC